VSKMRSVPHAPITCFRCCPLSIRPLKPVRLLDAIDSCCALIFPIRVASVSGVAGWSCHPVQEPACRPAAPTVVSFATAASDLVRYTAHPDPCLSQSAGALRHSKRRANHRKATIVQAQTNSCRSRNTETRHTNAGSVRRPSDIRQVQFGHRRHSSVDFGQAATRRFPDVRTSAVASNGPY